MPLAVYMPRTAGEAFEALLRARVGAEVRLEVGEAPARPARYEVLVAGRPREEDLDASAALRLVVVPYAGVPAATLEALQRRPRLALHNLHHNAAPTAEMAVGLLLAAARRLIAGDRDLRRGDWGLRYAEDHGLLLEGREALVLGGGAIGARVARALEGLGMRVTVLRRTLPPGGQEPRGTCRTILPDDLDDALAGAHVVVVALPATAETRGLLDARRLALLPRGAVLVNVARGDVVEEAALYDALVGGRLGAAGIDVWYAYPAGVEARGSTPPSRFPFGALDQVVLSPHRGGHVGGIEALRADHLARLLLAAARGEEIPHRVDLKAGY